MIAHVGGIECDRYRDRDGPQRSGVFVVAKAQTTASFTMKWPLVNQTIANAVITVVAQDGA